MSLSSLLSQAISPYSDDKGSWRQFVLDHLDFIDARSGNFDVDAETVYSFRYDLPRFLRERMSRQVDMAWIVNLLNTLPNDLAFDQAGTYVIPTDRVITDLYLSFSTVQNNQG